MITNKPESQSLTPFLTIASLTVIATVVYVGFGVASLVDKSAVLDVGAETASVDLPQI